MLQIHKAYICAGTHGLIIIIIVYSVIHLVSMQCVRRAGPLEFHPRIAEISGVGGGANKRPQLSGGAAFAHRMGLSSGRVKLKLDATTHSDYFVQRT